MENGINLAAEFPDNPFCPVMRSLDAAVWEKQVYERRLFEILNLAVWKRHFNPESLRKCLDNYSAWAAKEFPANRELLDACETIRQRALAKNENVPLPELARIRQIRFERQRDYQLKARELIKPVRHVIKVEPLP